MTDYDPLTLERLAVYTYSGLASAEDAMKKLSEHISSLCDDLLSQDGLSVEQIAGLRRTKSRIPGTFEAYRYWIRAHGWSGEKTENALFLLTTLADNLLSLGALAMRDDRTAKMVESIVVGGQKGGQKTARRRQSTAMAWKAIVEKEIVRIRQKEPDLSQDKLADEIIFSWKVDKPPGHQSITKHISAFDKARRALGNEGGSNT